MAASSTSAELIAVHDALDDVRVNYWLMKETFNIVEPITVFEDNTNTTGIAMGGERKRGRAIIIKCYDVLHAVQDKEIRLENVSSQHQLADGLTKALDATKFAAFVQRLFFPRTCTARPNGGVLE